MKLLLDPKRLTLLLAAFVLATGCAGEGVTSGGAAPDSAPPDAAELPRPWPPRVGAPYPDLELVDSRGASVRLSDFAGKVVLLEPIGMNCPACNAFAGAHEPGRGGFQSTSPQPGLPSIHEALERYSSGVELGDERLVFLHLLLYDYAMEAPDVEDARHWDEHFDVSRQGGLVVVPARDLRGKATYDLIPGFQLVDARGVLRFDSSGHRPRHNLWTELLPALPGILDGE